MRSFLSRFIATPTARKSVIHQVHEAVKPSLFTGAYSGNTERHHSMRITLDLITNQDEIKRLQKDAERNLRNWFQKKINPPLKVEVVAEDWGNATREAMKKFGVTYAVLNMANAKFPGGSVLEGGCAQEENMWHRTTCSLSLLKEGIYLDKESNTFLYNDETSKLVDALEQMSAEELLKLSQLRRQEFSTAYKVLLNKKQEICFRGQEVYIDHFDYNSGTSHRSAESSMSFLTMPDHLVFPFFELRSAAPDLSSNILDLKDKGVLAQYKTDLRRRIAAQLDTLILAEKTSVILGAWGCGAYKNNPEIVADIYGEEIEKRAEFFEHIIFPIFKTDSKLNNFTPFETRLNNLKLGGLTPSAKKAIREPGQNNQPRFFSTELTRNSTLLEETPEKGPNSHQ